jgi:hypothetical protein
MMFLQDGLEPSGIERAGFNELEQSRLIFGPAGLQGDCREMLGCKDPRRSAFNAYDNRLFKSLLNKRADGGQELDRPAMKDDVFSLQHAAPIGQVIEYRTEAYQCPTRLLPESHEDIYIQRGHRLKVKCRPHCPADGVVINHSIRLHPIDDADYLSNAHRDILSVGKESIPRFKSYSMIIRQAATRSWIRDLQKILIDVIWLSMLPAM